MRMYITPAQHFFGIPKQVCCESCTATHLLPLALVAHPPGRGWLEVALRRLEVLGRDVQRLRGRWEAAAEAPCHCCMQHTLQQGVHVSCIIAFCGVSQSLQEGRAWREE